MATFSVAPAIVLLKQPIPKQLEFESLFLPFPIVDELTMISLFIVVLALINKVSLDDDPITLAKLVPLLPIFKAGQFKYPPLTKSK